MIEILDTVDGTILGWLDETEVVLPSREHKRYFALPIITEFQAAVRFDPSYSPSQTDAYRVTSLKWHCVEFFRSSQFRNSDGSRGKSSAGMIWYLLVDGPGLPPDTWKARGWIKAGDDWLKR